MSNVYDLIQKAKANNLSADDRTFLIQYAKDENHKDLYSILNALGECRVIEARKLVEAY